MEIIKDRILQMDNQLGINCELNNLNTLKVTIEQNSPIDVFFLLDAVDNIVDDYYYYDHRTVYLFPNTTKLILRYKDVDLK